MVAADGAYQSSPSRRKPQTAPSREPSPMLWVARIWPWRPLTSVSGHVMAKPVVRSIAFPFAQRRKLKAGVGIAAIRRCRRRQSAQPREPPLTFSTRFKDDGPVTSSRPSRLLGPMRTPRTPDPVRARIGPHRAALSATIRGIYRSFRLGACRSGRPRCFPTSRSEIFPSLVECPDAVVSSRVGGPNSRPGPNPSQRLLRARPKPCPPFALSLPNSLMYSCRSLSNLTMRLLVSGRRGHRQEENGSPFGRHQDVRNWRVELCPCVVPATPVATKGGMRALPS